MAKAELSWMRTWVVFRLSLDLVTDDRLRASEMRFFVTPSYRVAYRGMDIFLIILKNIFLKFSLPLWRASSLHLQETLEDLGSLRIGRVQLSPGS